MDHVAIENFAANLRRECQKFESIAGICKAIEVNRQQFNKYLAGNHLPHARTRRKICEFLGVTEEEMFWPPAAAAAAARTPESKPNAPKPSIMAPALTSLLRHLGKSLNIESGANPVAPKDGYYFCYFPLQHHPEMLVRALMKIKTSSGVKSFVRHTYFHSGKLPTKFIAKGRHRGIVICSESEVSLVGMNFSEPHHPSLITFTRQHAAISDLMFGMSLTSGITVPYASRVCLEYLGEKRSQLAKTFQLTGVIHRSDASIHPSVALLLDSGEPSVPGQLDLPSIELMLKASSRAFQ